MGTEEAAGITEATMAKHKDRNRRRTDRQDSGEERFMVGLLPGGRRERKEKRERARESGKTRR
jgi:hypothetical protein